LQPTHVTALAAIPAKACVPDDSGAAAVHSALPQLPVACGAPCGALQIEANWPAAQPPSEMAKAMITQNFDMRP